MAVNFNIRLVTFIPHDKVDSQYSMVYPPTLYHLKEIIEVLTRILQTPKTFVPHSR